MKIGLGIGIPRQQSSSGGGSPFSPSDISDLELWLEADSGVTATGTNVTAWADQSSVGNDCTAFGTPQIISSALNGNPLIRFNGSTDYFFTDSAMTATGSQNRTIILVARNTGPTTGVFFATGASTTSNLYSINGELSVRVTAGNRIWNTSAISSTHVIGVIKLDGVDCTDLFYYENGQLITPSGTANRTIDTTATTASIGAAQNGSSNLTGDIAAVLIYAKALTDEERGQVETYLSTKYGIALA